MKHEILLDETEEEEKRAIKNEIRQEELINVKGNRNVRKKQEKHKKIAVGKWRKEEEAKGTGATDKTAPKDYRHLRFLFVMIAAVWAFVIVHQVTEVLFEKNGSMAMAFSASNAGEQEGVLEIMARHPGRMLGAEDKKKIIEKIGKEIGLTITGEPRWEKVGRKTELIYEKQARMAHTKLSVITLEKEENNTKVSEDYIYVRLCLNSSIASVTNYKEVVEECLKKEGCEDISTTIQLTGAYDGYLTLDKRNKIVDEILDVMGGEIAYEHRADDLYTVYAYTALLPEYITVEGKKINLHIAMSKDEEKYQTIVYLASPILPDTW